MNFSFGTSEILFGFFTLILLIAGGRFLVSEILNCRHAGGLPAGKTVPWRAGRSEVLLFAGVFVIALILLPGLGASLAKFVFPDVDLANNPVYIVGFSQPIALAFLWAICAVGKTGRLGVLTIADDWNAADAKPMRACLSLKKRGNVWQFFCLMLLAVTLSALLSQCVPLVFPQLKEAWAQNQMLVDNLLSLEDSRILFWAVPAIAVFTPIFEEILFRAGIYRLLKNKMPAVPAAILTGICFAIMHDSWAGILPLAVLSCVLCYAYERTGKLAVPIIMHGLFNLNTLVALFAGSGSAM